MAKRFTNRTKDNVELSETTLSLVNCIVETHNYEDKIVEALLEVEPDEDKVVEELSPHLFAIKEIIFKYIDRSMWEELSSANSTRL